MQKRSTSIWLLRFVVILATLTALLPFARLVYDWIEFTRVVDVELPQLPPRGFDWVRWQDQEGEIVAAYVDPRGTAYEAGIREGATLYQLNFQQYFSSEDVKRVIERSAGNTLDYEVVIDGKPAHFQIEITRYPTFLYPLDRTLWVSTGWTFALATFLHILALLIVVPLAFRSLRARRSSYLIGAALLWVGGTFVRFLIVSVGGPPDIASPFLFGLFEGLTLVSLAGWLMFPALLVYHVLADVEDIWKETRIVRSLLFLPPLILGLSVILATIQGSIGPIPPDALTAPVLFYVCVYVALATGLMLLIPSIRVAISDSLPGSAWSRAGSITVFVLSIAGALFAYGLLPALVGEDDARAGFFTVLLQLFSVAPVTLVSLASLRYGRFSYVLTRALAYVATLGLIFFAFIGGLSLLEAAGIAMSSSKIILGVWTLVLLVLVERLARPIHSILGERLRTDRDKARQQLNQFSDRVRTILDTERLAHETVRTVGKALNIESAVLFLRDPVKLDENQWTQATFQPTAPFFTQVELARVWGEVQRGGNVWAANQELNESRLSEQSSGILMEHRVSLVLPVSSGRNEPVGVFVLGRKAQKRVVYNLEDVEMLKALCGQIALATERLALIEREKALVRESAEAQLSALRAQINPHFLFNALNTIAALIAEKPEAAEDAVQNLSSIFRYVLQTGSRTFVPLREEIRLVKQYLAIEEARFGDNLRTVENWENDTLDVLVPAFVVQTLVENAVKHGIERKRGGGTVSLSSHKSTDNTLIVEVVDTGAGIPALFSDTPGANSTPVNKPDFFGIGLSNVADRLEKLYGRTGLLHLSSSPDNGTVARLSLPVEQPNLSRS